LGQGGEMTQALYAHMNNKTIKKLKKNKRDCQNQTKQNTKTKQKKKHKLTLSFNNNINRKQDFH
jgi:predicted nucleotide-binding protein (sugar kinase/HSP70/actin superfamily)